MYFTAYRVLKNTHLILFMDNSNAMFDSFRHTRVSGYPKLK